jgi:hypothetical protein
MGGMGGDGGMGGMGGTGGVTGPVTATPSGESFATNLAVELSTDGDGPIYYTTDTSPVLDEDGAVQGTEYTGPIALTATTVLKFLAQVEPGTGGAGGDSGPTYSPEQMEGYTQVGTSSERIQWAESGHGDITAEAWRHWDEDGEVPSRCAKCHGAQAPDAEPPNAGFLEYIGTGANTLPVPPPLGLECVNCHQWNPTVYSNLGLYPYLEPVEFPSGAELSVFSASNICMTCHQGRESGLDVQDTIDDDEGVGPYRFINIHYYPAAATVFGSEANGGYQYPGEDYRPRNPFPSHPDNYSNCIGCHMKNAEGAEAHTWAPGLDKCTACHDEGDSFATLKGSPSTNYDNLTTLVPELYAQIQKYADEVIGVPIEYKNGYPYFFNADTGGSYADFDAKLLPAAYNYQAALKDPAGFIHSGTYVQQFVHDSLIDIGGSTAVKVPGRGDWALNGTEVGNASESQQWQLSGHGALDEEPFRHWDDDGEIPGSCSKCHSAGGFSEFATNAATTSQLPTTGVDCVACHTSPNLFTNVETRWGTADMAGGMQNLEPVLFPSGAMLTLDNSGNLCMSCHQGRASGLDVDMAEDNEVDNGVTPSFDFINIHYYAAAATLFGSEANGGYQYSGETYRGRNLFVGLHTSNATGRSLDDCVGCHMNSSPDPEQRGKHTFMPQEIGDCTECHASGGDKFRDLMSTPRSNFFAIETLTEQLLTAIQDYAADGGLGIDSPIIYDSVEYPYWFHDNEMGAVYANRYQDFDRTLLRAAYNYQVALKDPAGYIHNGTYQQQIVWDSIVDLGACPNLNPPPTDRPPSPPTCP